MQSELGKKAQENSRPPSDPAGVDDRSSPGKKAEGGGRGGKKDFL